MNINSNNWNKIVTGSVDMWAIRLGVNNYCTSIEFSHPENRKHSCSRKWVRVQSLCRCRFDSPIFVKLQRDDRHRRDGRPRDVVQLISTIPMCKRTDEKKRAASFVHAPLSRTDEIKRVIFYWRKITGYEVISVDNFVWRIFIKQTRKIEWRLF